MPLIVGDVAVEFVAKLDGFFRALDKVGERLEKIAGDDAAIKVTVPDEVFKQLDRIATAVENISDLGDEVKATFLAVFDALDGKFGNFNEQLEDEIGRTIHGSEKLATDAFTRVADRAKVLITNVSPLAVAQLLGIGLLIERIVKHGFDLKMLLPSVSGSVGGLTGIVLTLVKAVRTLDLGLLLNVIGQIGGSLLSFTGILGLVLGAVRGIAAIFLNFLQHRPEGRLQQFTQLLATLNTGLNTLLLRSQRVIDQMLLISTGLVTITTLATTLFGIASTGIATVSGLVAPVFSMAIFGITVFRRLGTIVETAMLRFRAAAGDGRAQTILFLQALRQLFPILEALAANARPIAKSIREFARGGFDKKVKEVLGLMQTMVAELQRVANSIERLAQLLAREARRVDDAITPVMDKGKLLREQLGRSGARDAIAGVTAVRAVVVDSAKTVLTALDGIRARIFSLGGVFRTLKDVGVGSFRILGATIRGFVGKDSPFGVLFDAKRVLEQFSNAFSAIRKGMTAAFGDLFESVRMKFVDTFRNAERPVLKEIGDIALAGSNLFVNTFATLVNPIRAIIRNGLSLKGLESAAFAFGAALGKTISSGLSLAFKVGGSIFSVIGAGLRRLFSGEGPLSSFLSGAIGGAFRLLGRGARRVGDVARGRTGAAALDPEERAERQRMLLERRRVEQMRNQQDARVSQVLDSLVKEFGQVRENARKVKEEFKRTEIKLSATADTLDSRELQRFNREVLEQVDVANKYAKALTDIIPNLDHFEEQIRAAAKAAGMNVRDENRLVAALRHAESEITMMVAPVREAAQRLTTLKDSFTEVEGGFMDLPLDQLRVEFSKAARELGEWRKEIDQHEKDLAALSGVTTKAAEKQRRMLEKSLDVERAAAAEAKERLQAAKASIARQQLAKQLEKEIAVIQQAILQEEKASKQFGKLNSVLETVSRAFGGVGLARASEVLKETGKRVVTAEDARIAAIESQLRDEQALRERRAQLRKQLQQQAVDLAKRNAIDAELAVIEQKLAALGRVEAASAQRMVETENQLVTEQKNLASKSRKAGDALDAFTAVNQEAARSMAQMGKAVRRAGDVGGINKLISEIFAKEGAVESRLAGKKAAGSASLQNLKNNPAVQFFQTIRKEELLTEKALLDFFDAFNKLPSDNVNKVKTSLTKFFAIIRQAVQKNDMETLRRLLETFGAETVEFAARLREGSDAFNQFLSNVKKGSSRQALTGKQRNVLARELAEGIKAGITDAETILARFRARMKKDPVFSGVALNVPPSTVKKLQEQLNRVFDASRGTVDKKTAEMLRGFFEQVHHSSPPKRGPMREAELSLVRVGQTMAQQMMKGQGALTAGMRRMLQPMADMIHFKSPPLTGPLRDALLSIPRIGSTITSLLMKGLGPLQRGFMDFLRRGFQGPLDNFITQTSTQLKDLALTAQRMRMRPDDLRRFNEAIDLLGGSAQDAETALTQLVQNIDRAVTEGAAGELAVQFAKAGIAIDDLATMRPDEIFVKLVAAINAAEGDLETQSELLRLVGAEFTNMRGIILEGTDEIRTAFEETAKRPPLTDETVETAKRFTTMMLRTQQTLQRIALIVFEEIAPAVEQVINNVSGRGLPSVNEVLELVRAGARIVVRSIGEVATFIRDRWFRARNGLDNFLQDVTGLVSTLLDLAGSAISILFDKLGPVVSAGAEMLWAQVGSKTKQMVAGLAIDLLGVAAKITATLVAAVKAFIANARAFLNEAWLQAQKLFLMSLNGLSKEVARTFEGMVNGIASAFNYLIDLINEAIDLLPDLVAEELGLTKLAKLSTNFSLSARSIKRAIEEIDDEIEKIRPDGKSPIDLILEEFKRLDEGINQAKEDAKFLFDINLAQSEVETAIAAIADTAETAEEKLSRLRGILAQVAKDDALLSATDASADQIEQRLRDLAKIGEIVPGVIQEGRDRLIKQTKEAFMAAGGELARAFGDAFQTAGKNLEDLSPEVFRLGQLLNQISEEELSQVNTRLAELREKGVEGVDAIKKAFHEVNEEAKEFARQIEKLERDRELFDLESIGLNLRKQFREMAGAIGPFERAQIEVNENFRTMEQTLLDVRKKLLELAGDQEALERFGESFGLLITDNMTEEEIRRKIEGAIRTGFENGANQIKRGPVKQLVRDNFVGPLLDGFKETIRGLVDGTLIEAAKEAQAIAEQTGQKFSQALFIIADLGQRIFETAFNKLLDDTMELLTEQLSEAIAASFTSDAAAEGASNLGDVAGSAIGAAITAAIAVAGLLLSRLQSEISASKEEIESIVESTEAVRGVISGSTTVAIKEVQDTLITAQKPIIVRLDELIRIGRSLAGNGTIPISPLGGAGGTTI